MSPQLDRLDVGHGRHLARSADLPADREQRRGRLLGLKLVRHRPARKLVRIAEGAARGKIADLDDRAVDHVVEIAARLLDLVHGLDRALKRRAVDLAAGGGKAVLAQEVHHLPLGGEGAALDVADVVEAGVEPARRGDGGIEVAQRAGGGVAGILERLGGAAVVRLERGDAHKRLAVHLHPALKRDRQGDRANGHGLRQNLLADDAVAARRRADQPPGLIGQVDGQAVELVLDDELQRRKRLSGVLAQLFGAPRPVLERLEGLRLAHAPQPGEVRVRLKGRQRVAADAPRGRIGQANARGLFERDQFVVHPVPLRVRDGGVVQRIILVGGFVEPVDQLAHTVHAISSIRDFKKYGRASAMDIDGGSFRTPVKGLR